jgi:hypothetical protein
MSLWVFLVWLSKPPIGLLSTFLGENPIAKVIGGNGRCECLKGGEDVCADDRVVVSACTHGLFSSWLVEAVSPTYNIRGRFRQRNADIFISFVVYGLYSKPQGREREGEEMRESILLVICSVVSYGVTEAMKPIVKWHIKRRAYAQALMRYMSMLVGGLLGYELGWCSYHVWVGVSGGVLSSWIVAVLKEKVEKRLGVSVEDEKND